MRTIILATLAALIALATPADARTKKITLPPIIVTPNAFAAVQCRDALNKLPLGCTPRPDAASGADGAASSLVATFLKQIQTLVDPEPAIKLSSEIPGLQDPVGNVCWQSFRGIAAVVKAHPKVITGNVPGDYEALRLIHIGLNQICANPNCASMWTDLQNVQGAINPIAQPFSLGSMCAKVPVVSTTAAKYDLPSVDNSPAPSTPPAPVAGATTQVETPITTPITPSPAPPPAQ